MVGLVSRLPLPYFTFLDGHGRGPVGILPVDKVRADAAEVTNLAIVLAGEKERFRVDEGGTVRANDTNFGLVDQPIG
jgi:hypothetical protein